MEGRCGGREQEEVRSNLVDSTVDQQQAPTLHHSSTAHASCLSFSLPDENTTTRTYTHTHCMPHACLPPLATSDEACALHQTLLPPSLLLHCRRQGWCCCCLLLRCRPQQLLVVPPVAAPAVVPMLPAGCPLLLPAPDRVLLLLLLVVLRTMHQQKQVHWVLLLSLPLIPPCPVVVVTGCHWWCRQHLPCERTASSEATFVRGSQNTQLRMGLCWCCQAAPS